MISDTRAQPQSDPGGALYRAFLERGARAQKIHKWHHYFDIYERHFSPVRGQDIRMLEIGVQRGGSLELWKSYFGAASVIAGLDIDPACAALADERTKIYIGDQADPALLQRIVAEVGPFDIVLDDGGHRMSQMITSFEALYPKMNCPGVYLVEDTHTCSWGGSFADRADGETFLRRAQRLTEVLNEWTGHHGMAGFGLPPEQREREIPVSEFCRTTHGICFYDSIVVFERRHRPEPWHEIR